MKTPTMVYKYPGNDTKIGKERYATTTIDVEDLKGAEDEGWRCSPQEAKELYILAKDLEEAKKKAEEEAKTPTPSFITSGNGKKAPPAPKTK